VVATSDDEIPRLDAIWDQALANDVEGMERLTGEQARAMEPGLNAHAALLSPESGVFASHDYMLALQGEIEAAGGAVVLSTPFEGAEARCPAAASRCARAAPSRPPDLPPAGHRAGAVGAGVAGTDRRLPGRPHPAAPTTARASISA
jgi:hypothetical protein